jgi:nucleoside-diphosphate-sugar epimerase
MPFFEFWLSIEKAILRKDELALSKQIYSKGRVLVEPFKISSKEHIIITGGAGFIGSHLSERFLSEGKQVTILTRNIDTSRAQRLRTLGATLISWDCSHPQKLPNLQGISGAKVFLHLAADVSVTGPSLWSTNVEGTKRALEFAEGLKIPYFIYASSIEAQGLGSDQDIPLPEKASCHPVSDYGNSKVKAEEIVKNWGQENSKKSLILRIGNIYGPGSPWFLRPSLLALLRPNWVRPVWEILKKRKFQPLYISDLVEGILRSAGKRLDGVYNISGTKTFSIEDYFSELASLTKLTKQLEIIQSPTMDCEQLGQKVDPEFSYVLMGEADRSHRVYATEKIRREIGDYARWPLARGLAATLQWYHKTGGLPALLATFNKQQGVNSCMSL